MVGLLVGPVSLMAILTGNGKSRTLFKGEHALGAK